MRNIALATFLVLVTTAAHAQPGKTSVNVQFGDLDLRRADDAKILAERLQKAAEFACVKANALDIARNKIGAKDLQDCIDAATEVAIDRVASSFESNVRAKLTNARAQAPLAVEARN